MYSFGGWEPQLMVRFKKGLVSVVNFSCPSQKFLNGYVSVLWPKLEIKSKVLCWNAFMQALGGCRWQTEVEIVRVITCVNYGIWLTNDWVIYLTWANKSAILKQWALQYTYNWRIIYVWSSWLHEFNEFPPKFSLTAFFTTWPFLEAHIILDDNRSCT